MKKGIDRETGRVILGPSQGKTLTRQREGKNEVAVKITS